MRILLIRLRLVGDVVFTTPALGALRRRFPDASLTYLVEPAAAPIVAGHPALDDVIVAPRRRGWRRALDDLRLARRLRAKRFDLVVDFHGGPRASWLAWATGASRRVGYAIQGRSWMYTDVIPRARALTPRHSVENQWDLLARLDVPPPDRARDAVTMAEDRGAAERVSTRLAAQGIAPGDDVIVVHVSAGNPFRRWPAGSFAELAASLAARDPRRRLIFTSGPSDAAAADEVARNARARLGRERQRQIASCGEFDLPELRALVARAALYIGGDSGPLHVAATTDAPIVGIYGPTLAERSAPWRRDDLVVESVFAAELSCRPCDQRACVHGDFRCLGGIEPATVAAAAERALARAARRGEARANRTTPAPHTGSSAEAGLNGEAQSREDLPDGARAVAQPVGPGSSRIEARSR
jgi:lipopolysaccharide heptosyltransferase II